MGCLILFVAAITCLTADSVSGHGRLIDPPARNSMWRYGFSNPPNYIDNQLNCGGFGYQWSQGGKCGVCGDPYGKPQPHVAPGEYANRIIAKKYTKGQIINVKVEITSNHKGYFTFKIGDVGNTPLTEEKLNHVLKIAGTDKIRYYLPARSMNGIFMVSLQLPKDLVCKQCAIQWRYTAGNNWGTDSTGSGVGKGPQETFINCADVAITDSDGSLPQGPNPSILPKPNPKPNPNPNPDPMPNPEPNPNPNPNPNPDPKPNPKPNPNPNPNPKPNPKPNPNPNPNPKPNPKPNPTPKPNPPPNPNPGQGKNCRSAGAFAGQRGMDAWCQVNCPMNYCPVSHCICT